MGAGPFPTELFDDTGAQLAKRGHEFGATTGRARRCGWFDAVAVRTAVNINSLSGLCLTKLDVLDGLDEIAICVGYANGAGESVANPIDAIDYENVTPVYEVVPGWSDSTVERIAAIRPIDVSFGAGLVSSPAAVTPGPHW